MWERSTFIHNISQWAAPDSHHHLGKHADTAQGHGGNMYAGPVS